MLAVDRSASQRHVPDAREQRLLRMVLALEVGGHARIRHTGRWISQSASRHCRDVRARRFSELNTVDHGHACACVRILRCSICYDFWCGLDGAADPREPESTSRASLQSLEKAGGSRNPDYHARINARHGRIVRFKCLSNNIDSHITTDAGAKAPRNHDVHAAAQTHDRYR